MALDATFWIMAVIGVAAALCVVFLRNIFRAALAHYHRDRQRSDQLGSRHEKRRRHVPGATARSAQPFRVGAGPTATTTTTTTTAVDREVVPLRRGRQHAVDVELSVRNRRAFELRDLHANGRARSRQQAHGLPLECIVDRENEGHLPRFEAR